MCFSAMLEADLRILEREYEAIIGWQDFSDIFEQRLHSDVKILKALELQFGSATAPEAKPIQKSIDEYRARKAPELEQKIFAHKQRLAIAERALKVKPTKKAAEDQRIATNKIEADLRRLEELKRTQPKDGDSRCYPFYFVPIVVQRGKERVIIPARYHCRPDGKPEFFDRKYPGLFNARRTSLNDFWKGQFCNSHALMLIRSFYENVPLHKFERRALRPDENEQNVVVHYNPTPSRGMNVACLWSQWHASGKPSLNSFAAITDEPTPEVAASGHDRGLIVLNHNRLDDWLSPQGHDAAFYYSMFDEREQPYLEYRVAA